MIKNRYLVGLLATAVLAVAGCTSQQEPATQALNAAQSAFDAIREDAGRYVPDQIKDVESKLALLKDQLAKKDYRAVIAGAPGLSTSVGLLKEAAASRKADFESEWASVEGDVGQMVEALQSRVDTLGKSRRLPKEVSKEAFESAKAGLDQMKTSLESAKTAATGGNLVDAVNGVKAVQAKGKELLTQLGMTTG